MRKEIKSYVILHHTYKILRGKDINFGQNPSLGQITAGMLY